MLVFRKFPTMNSLKRVVRESPKRDTDSLWHIEYNPDIALGGPAREEITQSTGKKYLSLGYRETISNAKNFQIEDSAFNKSRFNVSILTKEMSRKSRSIMTTITRNMRVHGMSNMFRKATYDSVQRARGRDWYSANLKSEKKIWRNCQTSAAACWEVLTRSSPWEKPAPIG